MAWATAEATGVSLMFERNLETGPTPTASAEATAAPSSAATLPPAGAGTLPLPLSLSAASFVPTAAPIRLLLLSDGGAASDCFGFPNPMTPEAMT